MVNRGPEFDTPLLSSRIIQELPNADDVYMTQTMLDYTETPSPLILPHFSPNQRIFHNPINSRTLSSLNPRTKKWKMLRPAPPAPITQTTLKWCRFLQFRYLLILSPTNLHKVLNRFSTMNPHLHHPQ